MLGGLKRARSATGTTSAVAANDKWHRLLPPCATSDAHLEVGLELGQRPPGPDDRGRGVSNRVTVRVRRREMSPGTRARILFTAAAVSVMAAALAARDQAQPRTIAPATELSRSLEATARLVGPRSSRSSRRRSPPGRPRRRAPPISSRPSARPDPASSSIPTATSSPTRTSSAARSDCASRCRCRPPASRFWRRGAAR